MNIGSFGSSSGPGQEPLGAAGWEASDFFEDMLKLGHNEKDKPPARLKLVSIRARARVDHGYQLHEGRDRGLHRSKHGELT